MELCKVTRLEVAYLHQGDSQCITHSQCCGSTAGRGEVQRACLLLYLYGDMMVRVFCQQGIWISCDGDDRYIHVKYHRDETEQFIGLTAVTQCQNHIFVGHHT